VLTLRFVTPYIDRSARPDDVVVGEEFKYWPPLLVSTAGINLPLRANDICEIPPDIGHFALRLDSNFNPKHTPHHSYTHSLTAKPHYIQNPNIPALFRVTLMLRIDKHKLYPVAHRSNLFAHNPCLFIPPRAPPTGSTHELSPLHQSRKLMFAILAAFHLNHATTR
jgi:hypothetical protein